MAVWDEYPANYRQVEVQAILQAVRSGECTAVIGLSGSGKSNLLGFLAHRRELWPTGYLPVWIDCNRLTSITPKAFFELVGDALEKGLREVNVALSPGGMEIGEQLEKNIQQGVEHMKGVCLIIDRFDALCQGNMGEACRTIFGNLRALRDEYKYRLTYVIGARRPLAQDNELAELFFSRQIWFGPLSEADARWNILRYQERWGGNWDEAAVSELLRLSGKYPAFLRAVCEAYNDTKALNLQAMIDHPAVRRRLEEFWADTPSQADQEKSGLAKIPLLQEWRPQIMGKPSAQSEEVGIAEQLWPAGFDPNRLTAREYKLLNYLAAHAGQVCEKDELMRAVWPEDQIFEQGMRDESLAQLVRRLRVKLEVEPAEPRYIQTAPGRGYMFRKE